VAGRERLDPEPPGQDKRFGRSRARAARSAGLRQPQAAGINSCRRPADALVKVQADLGRRRALVKVVKPATCTRASRTRRWSRRRSAVRAATTRAGSRRGHQGGGHKRHYRIVDFRRNKDGIVAKVERLEYDPNRSAHIALVCYADGERRYIIAPKGLAVGAEVVSGQMRRSASATRCRFATFRLARHPLRRDAAGQGAQMARAAGTSVQLLAREGSYAQLRMRSGEIRRVLIDCRHDRRGRNEENSLRQFGKAGRCAGVACGRRCAAWP